MNKGFAQQRPVLLKIAPDLTHEQIDDVIDLAHEIKLDGLVAANTTISREQLATNRDTIQDNWCRWPQWKAAGTKEYIASAIHL
jgi:dihydroorotate dehydrogenase